MQIKTSGEVGLLYLDGVVHRETADDITTLFNIIKNSKINTIIISFNDVKALLSDGIRLMVSLSDSARKAGKNFYITDLPKEVKYTLKITNLLELLGYAGSSLQLLKENSIDESTLIPMKLPEAYTQNSGFEESSVEEKEQKTEPVAAVKPNNSISAFKMAGQINTHQHSGPNDPHIKARQLSSHHIRHLSDADIKQAVDSHVPGRTEIRIVDCMMKSQRNALSAADLSKHLRTDEEAVKKALSRLSKRGTVSNMGGGLYNYAPSEDVKNQIEYILQRLREKDNHSKILRYLLACEH